LTALMLLLVVLGLISGTAAVVGIEQRSGLVGSVRNGSGPLTVQAQQLYRSLSDADATAASAFLANGVEPAALRQRYLDDVSAASQALATVTAGADVDRTLVDRISRQLPVYAGLVDTARTYNRLGIPLGAAYLREASGLMRGQLLPAAQDLYKQESNRLSADLSGAARFPWLAVPLLLVTIGVLLLAGRYLSRRTHRLLNVGLLVALGAAVLMLLWTTVSWAAVQGHLDRANATGSTMVNKLAQARIAALNARADEALTLVARGGGADFEKDFGTQMHDLAAGGDGGLLASARTDAFGETELDIANAQTHVKAWLAAHAKLREQDAAGNYTDAVKLATGTDAGTAADAFNHLDADLAAGIDNANEEFNRDAQAAAGGFTLAAPGLIVLTLLMLAGSVAGLQQRIAEYR
jgi:hypothetical protein